MTIVTLPTLHAGQVRAFRLLDPTTKKRARFKAIRCGRRWGKTMHGEVLACDGATKRQNIGIFAPDYKILAETYGEIADILDPIKQSASRLDGVIRTTTGGRIDFWSLDNERAGRSRKYHKVIIDEGAFTKPNMMKIWQTAIRPTLLDFSGTATVLSTPNGTNQDNFFWRICNEPEHGFVEYHAPTHDNPYLPQEELDKLQAENHPMVFRQEYLAEFVDWSNAQFFSISHMLVNEQPVAVPTRCDSVFCTIDTAVKTGKDNDGTAVSYWAVSQSVGHPLVLLDWDIVQIEGSLLEVWMPTVFENLEIWAKRTGARMGSVGAFIEDKVSGTILIQQAMRRGWQVHPIDSKLTSVGKDERAISISGYVYRGMVKMSAPAYEKTVTYKQATRNYFITQVFGYRLGVPMQADDMLDSFCYAVAIALGDSGGY